MSIENLIADLTAAIREQTSAILAAKSVPVTAPAAAEDKKPSTAKEAIEQATAAAKEAKAKKEAEAAKKEAEAAKSEEDKALDYDKDIAPALTAFLKKHGRDAFGTLLQPFGAKKGGEVKADDYAALLAAIDEFELTA